MAIQYLVKVLRVAFSHSLSRAQDTIFVLLILGGIVTFFMPALHMSIDVSGWQIAAVVLGGIVALRLLLAPYWIYRADQETIHDLIKRQVKSSGASGSRTTLSVALYQRDLITGNRSHRIIVTNEGSVVAENVKVSLRGIAPHPPLPFRSDFPYEVPKVSDAYWQRDSTMPISAAKINPNGGKESFRLFESWLIGDQSGDLAMQGLDTKRNGESYSLRTKPEDEWVLEYEVTSANAPSIEFSITVGTVPRKVRSRSATSV